MNAVVVYESLWGNTAAIAHAIAEGLGAGTRALSTAEASSTSLSGVDLLVVGAPVLAFKMPSERTLKSLSVAPADAPAPPDLSQPPMKVWLEALPAGRGYAAAFDTQVRGPFGSAASSIRKSLEHAGYRSLGKPTGFIVGGKYGPLKEGELDRARVWGEDLARAYAATVNS